MKVPLFDRVVRFLSGSIIVCCLLVIFTAFNNVRQSGDRLINTIDEKKSATNGDIAKKLDVINKKLDEIMMKVK
ncbi:hypothetical protein H6M98_002115 [Salmonella enterica subsp. enterica serovar Kirkee]|uniref:Uncharacterized protein n=1 Tax=Salmonella enterica I TaxID=59201 RepID=A0A379V305_SALET|nr:hypothetical protein [Salmonella enterica subsp. enterica serovar Kirkee]EGA9156739.1 hypothetical protein [Salmonella enterica subsp. enterica serovar Kirkee]SUG74643.1 Uncharacterised protein [Salmonella enterica subsp. enterica]